MSRGKRSTWAVEEPSLSRLFLRHALPSSFLNPSVFQNSVTKILYFRDDPVNNSCY
jgi:hypothetical protein